MKGITKVFLTLAIVCIAAGLALNIGLVDVEGMDALYAVLPFGATFAGLFLISKLLEKESTGYDTEHGASGAEHSPKRNS